MLVWTYPIISVFAIIALHIIKRTIAAGCMVSRYLIRLAVCVKESTYFSVVVKGMNYIIIPTDTGILRHVGASGLLRRQIMDWLQLIYILPQCWYLRHRSIQYTTQYFNIFNYCPRFGSCLLYWVGYLQLPEYKCSTVHCHLMFPILAMMLTF
jgi:hypothetical protein